MSQFFHIHPTDPQSRLIHQSVDIIRQGGVIIYPTDSGYALGCRVGDKSALDRIKQIRKLDDKHHFTLVCRDLSEIATYAVVDNVRYRLLKTYTPGPYTFLLRATKEVPRRLQHAKRKTIGIRVPDCRITQDLLAELNEPLMSSSLILPHETQPLFDPDEIYEQLSNQVDLVIDGGYGDLEPTTVVDLFEDTPIILRAGKGDMSGF